MKDINSILKQAYGILAATATTETGDILDEHRIKYIPLGLKDLKELIQTEFSSAYKKLLEGKIIFRGVGDADRRIIKKCSLLKPGLRVSENAQYNLYTRLFSGVLPSWRGYPPRNRSFTCSTSTSYAVMFTNDEPESFINVYTVLPRNGANLGVCPSGDLWGSFNFLVENEYSLELYEKLLMGIFEFLGKQIDEVITIKTGKKSTEFANIYTELKKAAKYGSDASIIAIFNRLSTKLKPYVDDIINKVIKEYSVEDPYEDTLDYMTDVIHTTIRMLYEMKKRGSTDIIQFLDDLFNPKANGIKKVTIEQFNVRSSITTDPEEFGQEVWTDSDCIFTKLNYLKRIAPSIPEIKIK